MSSEQYARQFVHPDDISLVGTEIRKAIETTDPDFSRQIEHRIIFSDGEIGYISVRFFVKKDRKGRTIKTFGANQDITERKQAEENLKKRMNELQIFNDATVNREIKMIELKKEINELMQKSGQEPKYEIPV